MKEIKSRKGNEICRKNIEGIWRGRDSTKKEEMKQQADKE